MHYIVSAPPRRFSSHSVLSVVNVEFLSWHMSKNKKNKNPGLSQVAQEEKLTMAAEVPAVALAAVVTQIFVRRFSSQNAK